MKENDAYNRKNDVSKLKGIQKIFIQALFFVTTF